MSSGTEYTGPAIRNPFSHMPRKTETKTPEQYNGSKVDNADIVNKNVDIVNKTTAIDILEECKTWLRGFGNDWPEVETKFERLAATASVYLDKEISATDIATIFSVHAQLCATWTEDETYLTVAGAYLAMAHSLKRQDKTPCT